MQKLKPHSCRLGACTLFWIFLVAGSVAASATLVADYCVENTGTECTTGEAYGLWLPGIEAGESDRTYEFDAGATFTQNDDGTAVLVGTATLDGSKGYFVEVNFGGRTSIAPSGSPKEDFCAWDPDTSSYYYYTAISGTLSGLPGTSLAGAVVTLTRRGPAFQVGVGANLQEHVLGASGWFDWELVSQATGGADLKASGHGDFNFNLVACDPTEPNCENNVTELTTFDSRTRSENPANLAAFIAAICDLAPDRVIDFETGFADGQYIGAGHFLTDYRVRIYSEEHSPAHDDVEIRSNLAGSTPIGNLGAVVWTELKSSYIDFYEHPVDYVGFYLTDVGFDNFGIDIEYTDGSKDTIVSDKTGENCTCEEFVGIVAEPGKKIQRIAINPNQFTGDYGIDNIIFGDCEGCCIEQDPVLSGVPGDLVLDCTDPIPDPAVVVAVDFEGNSIPVVFEETTTGGACDKRITRVWTAIDSCENEVSVTQTIVVSDTEPPIFTSIPEDEYIECKPPVIDCEPCDGGVTSLTLLYAGSAGQVTIRDDRAVYFQGALAPGEAVTINGTRSDGRFEKNELKLYVGSVENVRIHVSCSKPIGVGMVFGDFTVLAGASRNGGALCPMDGGDPGCGACKGGVTRLVLQYGGSAGQVVIRDDRETYFSGSVQTGELIEINGTKSDGKFEKNELTLSVDGHEDARIHVSCSKPIDIGLSFGSFLVVDGASKDNGSFCPSDGGIIPPIITAVDNCDPNVEVVFTETSNTVNCAGIITRTWTATDACGNSTSVTQNIIYGDVTPPVLSGVPLDAEYTCVADVPLPPVVTVDDNCDDDLVVLYEEIVEGVCPTIITRVWTAIDSCGNEVSATQTIVVSDTEAPVFTGITDRTITLDCDDPDPEIPVVHAVDNCAGDITVVPVVRSGGDACRSETVLTWTAADACGNSNSVTWTIIRVCEDFTLVCPDDMVVNCDDGTDPALTGEPSATSTCSPVVSITYIDHVISCSNGVYSAAQGASRGAEFDGEPCCAGEKIIIRTWTATTANGDVLTCEQVIRLIDNTPPLIACEPGDHVQCVGDVPGPDFTRVTVWDTCSDPVVTVIETNMTGTVCDGRVDYVFEARDACGNVATCTQTWYITDTQPPVLVGISNRVFNLACDDPDPVIPPVAVTDNCDNVVTVEHSTTNSGDICHSKKVLTWTPVDICGNVGDTVTWIINRVDDAPPVLVVGGDIDITVAGDCTYTIPNLLVSVTDVCTPASGIVVTQDPAPGTVVTGPVEVVVTLVASDACDSTTKTVNVKVSCLASLGDYVWLDENADGFQDSSEPGVSNVTVILWRDQAGIPIQRLASNQTDATGFYVFVDLDPNLDYRVQFIRPAGYEFTIPNNVPGNDGEDSDAHPVNGFSDVVELDAGEHDPTIDAGLVVPDITIIKKVGPAATNPALPADLRFADGEDDFLVVPCGSEVEYCFKVTNSGRAPLFNVVINDPTLGIANLPVGNLAVGASAYACVDGSVVTGYVDNIATTIGKTLNHIEVSDKDPVAVDCGDITLIKKAGTRDDSLTVNVAYAAAEDDLLTVACGTEVSYCFKVINSGNHPLSNIVVTDPILGFATNFTGLVLAAGDEITFCVVGGSVSVGLTNTARVDAVADTVPVSDDDPVRVACEELASLGDYVWLDEDQDGCQDSAEPGVAGVTVTLYESIGGTPVNNLGSKLTDKDGGYLFTDLDPNKDYMVEFTLPPGFVFTQQGVPADDSKDSDASPLTGRTGQIELDPGENDLTNDAGLIQVLPGLLIGVSDPGCNCAGVPIDLTIHVENTGNTTLLDVEIIDATFPICSRFIGTLAAGVSTSYVCTVPAPPSTVTNSVLVTAKDLTGSTVTKNSDFTMDVDTQPPIIVNCPPGGFVECLADVPAPEIPAAVDNCDTVVVVTVSTVIENGSRPCVKRVIYTYTAIDDCGNQASCTETWTVEDLTPPIIVGVSNQTFNLSCDDPDPVIPPVSAIDNCEQVTVSIVSNLVGDVCSSMKTITFSVVDACNNAAQVVWIINKSDTTPPVLSCPTLQPVLADGNCEGVIPDVVPDVVATDNCGNPVTVVQSPAPGTKVGLGTHIITVTATDPCGLASTCKTVLEVLPVSGAIGDTVWNDINADGIQDPGDPPVDGVTVRLRGPGGVLVGTDVTAGGGQYLFTNVAAGTYSVEFVLLPPFAAFTLKGSGAPDVDSNANPDGSTDSFIISCGETNRTVDAGLVDTGAIACKVTSNPPMVTGIETPIGSDNFVSAATVTWTVEVSNPRQIGLENIAVTDTRCGALLLQGGDTDNDSILDPGETWIYTCVDANPTFSRGLNISNVVTVSGVDLVGTPVGSSCQAELVTVGINMEKRAPAACAGDEVTYTLITRMVNGDPRVQLRNIEVVDNLCTNLMLLPGSDKNNNGFLDFGETFTNTCTRVVSQTHTNTATDFADVFFDGVFSGTVNSEAMVVVPVDQPGLALNAVVKNLPVLSGGGAIVEVTVSNTGNVDLHNVQVSNGNPDFGACDFTIATLPVGGVETRTCTSSPLVGFVVNSMNVTAASARDCAASDGFTLEVETETVPEEDIAGTLFCDADGDGVEDLSETNGLPGVQVDLLRDGFPFRTTTTDAEGGYEFTSVPTGNYAIVVSATDPALSNALIGPASALVNPVTLADQDQIVDIGFVIANATIDGFLFESLDKSGAPNNFALTGFNGIEVILKQVTDTKVVEVDRTTTAANGPDNGYYAFTGKAGGRYLVETVAVQVEAAMLARKRAENPKLLRLLEFIETSPGGEIVTFCENGSQNLSFFASIQTAIRLASFEAEVDGEHVVVNWSTASETRNFGFNVYRSSSLNGQQTMVNARMILASGTGVGAVYSTLDVKPGAGRYFYWLEDVDLYGKATRHDPVSVLVGAGAEMKGGFDVIKPGMAKVTHAVLAGSGLADYARVAVFADGVEIPAFVADGDYFLFYIREGVKRIEFGLKVDPKRMAQFELIQE
jgi:hypothetical protein